MKVYGTKEIRNVGIVGHGDSGKTSVVSAMLFVSGATNRLGRVDEGTTVTDYDEDEIARRITIHSSLAHCEWNQAKINLLDTPGYAAFILDAKAALRAADAVVVLVDAVNGVEVQTEKTWSYAEEFGLPRLIVVNKMDRERADFDQAVASINEAFGREAVPFQIPIGSERNFRGVIDLIHMRAYTYEGDGSGKPTEGEIPADLRTNKRIVRAVRGPYPLHLNRHVFLDNGCDLDLHGGRRRGRSGFTLAVNERRWRQAYQDQCR